MSKTNKQTKIIIIMNRFESFVVQPKDMKKFLQNYGFNTKDSGRVLDECDVYELVDGEVFEIEERSHLKTGKYKI